MPERKYGPGDVFAVPLRAGGFGLGLIARGGSSSILLGYFFGPKWADLPTMTDVGPISSGDAVLVGRFSYLGLKEGHWPVLGQLPGWVPADWPTPVFVRTEPFTNRSFLVFYNEAASKVVGEELVPRGEAVQGLPDVLMGAGSVEIRLTRLLAASA